MGKPIKRYNKICLFSDLIGQKIPDHWRQGVHFDLKNSNILILGEVVIVARSNSMMTYGVIENTSITNYWITSAHPFYYMF